MFQSTKLFDGYSCTFRQWRAEGTHCKYLHGYAISFKITFEGELDEKNWVWDFGGMKRAKGKIDGKNPKEWMDYMFDHTTFIAKDDPALALFEKLNHCGVIQLRVIEDVGAERFAQFVFNKINGFILAETEGRVKVVEVEVFENQRNSAIYKNNL